MAFLIPTKFVRSYPLLALLSFILLFYSYYCIMDELAFSAVRDSSFISFDDFSADYSKALNDSVSQRTPIKYDRSPSSTAKIPRIIHQIWFTRISGEEPNRTEIPPIWSSAQALCREKNPDYTYYTWTDDVAHDFLQQSYEWFIPTYDGYTYPIQRVDALKYFLLWHYGGIYIDLDISCRRPLDPLLEFSAWFPEASPVGVNNDLMASRPGHPVFGRLVHSLQSHNKNYLFTYLTVFWSTGPMFVNTILKGWYRDLAGKAHSGELSKNITDNHISLDRNHIKSQIKVHRYSGPSDVAILPQIFYSEEYTFFGHRPGGSWHSDDVAVVLWIYERLWVLLGAGFMLVGIIFAIRRARRKRMAYSRLRGLYGKAA